MAMVCGVVAAVWGLKGWQARCRQMVTMVGCLHGGALRQAASLFPVITCRAHHPTHPTPCNPIPYP